MIKFDNTYKLPLIFNLQKKGIYQRKEIYILILTMGINRHYIETLYLCATSITKNQKHGKQCTSIWQQESNLDTLSQLHLA